METKEQKQSMDKPRFGMTPEEIEQMKRKAKKEKKFDPKNNH